MSETNLIDEFLNYLRFERHFSPHTAKCYAADLAQFCEFMSDPTGHGSSIAGGGSNGSYDHGHGGVAVAAGPAMATATRTHARQMLLAVEPEDVRRFLAFLKERAYCKSTTARKLATLRSF